MPAPAAAAAVFPLLADGALRLEAIPALIPFIERWLPLLPYDDTPVSATGAAIRLGFGSPRDVEPPGAPPVVLLGAADAWVDDAAAAAVLRCAAGCAGTIDLDRLEASLLVPEGAEADVATAWDVHSMCTVTAALLLGRMGRALVHAAAVVAPGGSAWLLVGDTHAGKSTTCVNLIEAGWGYVSDDHVVLFRAPDGRLCVEGWPRRFHLDEGWHEGEPGRDRGEIDPHRTWPGRWQRTAPLGGLLFPRVRANEPTRLSPVSAATALTALMRQSPWLVADRAIAPDVLAFLRTACHHPAFSLRLGLDTYRDTARLVGVLSALPHA